MAVADAAIELPTNRQSRYFDGPGPNVHDPNYIPVLNGAEIRVDFSQPSFSALPSIPTPHQNVAQTSLKRSKSGSAPEMVVYKSDTPPLPNTFLRESRNATPTELSASRSPVEPRKYHFPSSGSEDNTASQGSNSEASTDGAGAVLEEQVFMIPGNTAPKADQIQFPTVPHSSRSSISSNFSKKSTVPTSRYNQQKAPSVPTIPASAIQSRAPSVRESRQASPELNQPSFGLSSPASTPLPPSLPPSAAPSPVPPHPPAVQRLQAHKSTASDRRNRALHSHPSNISLKSASNSIVDETDEVPLMQPITMPESRPPSSRSRSQSIVNSQQPTPAPNTPLPALPPDAKRPPTREKQSDKNPFVLPLPNSPLAFNSPSIQAFLSPSPTTPTNQNDHVEMAEFITQKKMTIFRRFDDVHVRLLLHLQDEIAALEKELLSLEEASQGKPEKSIRKANIMRELRKVLAEYDHLFANWSSMQANKANNEMKEQLAIWLANPATGSGAVTRGAKADLEWLNNAKDLSAISIDPEKRPPTPKTIPPASYSKPLPSISTNSSGGAGGILALFNSCISKRK